MSTVLFEPHADDAVLFAAYSLMRVAPRVITVLGADPSRQIETANAMDALMLTHSSWPYSETIPDWRIIRERMASLDADNEIESVFVPLEEEGGHEQHNRVSELAVRVFGDRCRFYTTYRRGFGRTRTEHEVIPEPHWPALKFAAMACYRSQINLPATRPWFAADDMLREWTA